MHKSIQQHFKRSWIRFRLTACSKSALSPGLNAPGLPCRTAGKIEHVLNNYLGWHGIRGHCKARLFAGVMGCVGAVYLHSGDSKQLEEKHLISARKTHFVFSCFDANGGFLRRCWGRKMRSSAMN